MNNGTRSSDVKSWGCDAHVHVIGDRTQYPMALERHYTPAPADTTHLLNHLTSQELGRVVIVQPSVYGTDNRCLLDAITTLGPMARGIAVLDENASNSALIQLDSKGIRGIRLNFESSANYQIEHLQNALRFWSSRIASFGWHIQVYAPFEMIALCANTIKTLPTSLVLDHFALWPANRSENSLEKSFIDLLGEGHIYIKLSASYRLTSWTESNLQELSHQLVKTNPEQLLWGSDWPHTNREYGLDRYSVSRYRDIKSEQLLNERLKWLPTAELQHQVMVSNAAKLYGY
mgnify:FL=1